SPIDLSPNVPRMRPPATESALNLASLPNAQPEAAGTVGEELAAGQCQVRRFAVWAEHREDGVRGAERHAARVVVRGGVVIGVREAFAIDVVRELDAVADRRRGRQGHADRAERLADAAEDAGAFTDGFA